MPRSIDLKNTRLRIKDGTSNSLIVEFGEGNLTYSERKEREYILNRGALDDVRDGDEQPMELSFEGVWQYTTSGGSSTGVPTIENALKKTGAAAAWTSSDTDACRPYAVDLELSNLPPCTSGDQEILTFPDFRYEQLDHDLQAGTISVQGKCNATMASASRITQSSGSVV